MAATTPRTSTCRRRRSARGIGSRPGSRSERWEPPARARRPSRTCTSAYATLEAATDTTTRSASCLHRRQRSRRGARRHRSRHRSPLALDQRPRLSTRRRLDPYPSEHRRRAACLWERRAACLLERHVACLLERHVACLCRAACLWERHVACLLERHVACLLERHVACLLERHVACLWGRHAGYRREHLAACPQEHLAACPQEHPAACQQPSRTVSPQASRTVSPRAMRDGRRPARSVSARQGRSTIRRTRRVELRFVRPCRTTRRRHTIPARPLSPEPRVRLRPRARTSACSRPASVSSRPLPSSASGATAVRPPGEPGTESRACCNRCSAAGSGPSPAPGRSPLDTGVRIRGAGPTATIPGVVSRGRVRLLRDPRGRIPGAGAPTPRSSGSHPGSVSGVPHETAICSPLCMEPPACAGSARAAVRSPPG
jgi:hypothetical protein